MGNRFLMALYRPSEALLDQIFMQRWGLSINECVFAISKKYPTVSGINRPA